MTTSFREIIVFVGDTTKYLSDEALAFNKDAKLITSSNSSKLDAGVYYCSLGDLSGLNEFSHVLRQASTIHYSPPPKNKWTDKKLKEWTEEYLTAFSCDCKKIIYNFKKRQTCEKDNILKLSDSRKTNNPQIWIAGCSISHGIGVLPDERYGHLFAKSLDIPVSFLTKRGTSIRWAADQILRSDIRSGDIVVWGITSSPRISYWNSEVQKVESCNPRVFGLEDYAKYIRKSIKENYFVSGIPTYEALQSIDTVDNVMEKRGVKLLKGILIFSDLSYYIEPEKNLLVLSGIYGKHLEDLYIDIGSDGKHPGPKTHQMFCEKFLERYRELYL